MGVALGADVEVRRRTVSRQAVEVAVALAVPLSLGACASASHRQVAAVTAKGQPRPAGLEVCPRYAEVLRARRCVTRRDDKFCLEGGSRSGHRVDVVEIPPCPRARPGRISISASRR